MPNLKICPLPILLLKTPKAINTYLVDITKIIDNYSYCFYIEGSEKKILVDTSCPAESMIVRGHQAETISTPYDELKKLDISPEEIDIVIFTHLHVDHIGYSSIFNNAKFIVQKTELETAYNPHPIQRINYRDTEILDTINFETVQGDAQIVPGVDVIWTPGHTQGTQSVVVNTEKGKAVIAGMCSIRENFEPPDMIRNYMPVIVTGIHIDVDQSYNSLIRIKNIADIVIPCHDPEFAKRNQIP